VFSTYLLHTRTGWVGYEHTGGLLHVAFLTLITPPLLQNCLLVQAGPFAIPSYVRSTPGEEEMPEAALPHL